MSSRWSEEEFSILKEYYPTHTTDELMEKLDRTERAIQRKAAIHDIGKQDNFHILSSRRQENVKFDDDDFSRFICGFVAGEGSFTTKSASNGRRHTFTIGMSVCDKEILYEIQDFLSCGNIYEYEAREEEWKGEVKYCVQSAEDIWTYIIPFFDKYGFYSTHKQKQYEEWRQGFIDRNNLERNT